MANLTEKPWVSVPEFGEWRKPRNRNKGGVFTRDYSRHFEMMRSVRRYRKKLLLLSWTSIRNGTDACDWEQSCSLGRSDSVSKKKRDEPGVGRYMCYLFCCVGH